MEFAVFQQFTLVDDLSTCIRPLEGPNSACRKWDSGANKN